MLRDRVVLDSTLADGFRNAEFARRLAEGPLVLRATKPRWYYQSKNEHALSRREGRLFVNPVEETVLRERS